MAAGHSELSTVLCCGVHTDDEIARRTDCDRPQDSVCYVSDISRYVASLTHPLRLHGGVEPGVLWVVFMRLARRDTCMLAAIRENDVVHVYYSKCYGIVLKVVRCACRALPTQCPRCEIVDIV